MIRARRSCERPPSVVERRAPVRVDLEGFDLAILRHLHPIDDTPHERIAVVQTTLNREADPRGLADAAQCPFMRTRRTLRITITTALSATLAAVVGCQSPPIDAAPSGPPGAISPGAVGPSGSAGPAATATGPSGRPVAIADASTDRLLQGADAYSSYDPHPARDDELTRVVRLPCATGGAASDARIIDRAGMSMSFASEPPPYGLDSQVSEALTIYRPGGASQYMSELAAALTACPTEAAGSSPLTRTLVQRDFAGDESLLIGYDYPAPANPAMPAIRGAYLVALRADDVVMVLLVTPFESGNVRRGTLDSILAAAIARAED
jgi:hypothetical protein